MDSIKQSLNDLAHHFNTTMAEFQQNLNTSIPATSPTSNIAAQFSTFRTFVLSALENLQQQVNHLSKQQDHLDMNTRKKILLVHGVPEAKNEDVTAVMVKLLSDRLDLPDLSIEDISRCHRIGSSKVDKHRVVLIKFKRLLIRNQVWYAKTKLKNTGTTISEFLTKTRHDAFMAARQRFGVSKCWTREGVVFVITPSGTRHRISSRSELDNIPGLTDVHVPAANTGAASTLTSSKARAAAPTQVNRARRNIKK
ncbi:unnamed protein product, partial [Brenthis ino]